MKMKINLDLPDRAKERTLRLFAGIELVAYLRPDEKGWFVIERPCSECGDCCAENSQSPFGDKDRCRYLKDEGPKRTCSLKTSRPFSCSAGTTAKGYPRCQVKFKKN